jgi:hypothetical protein
MDTICLNSIDGANNIFVIIFMTEYGMINGDIGGNQMASEDTTCCSLQQIAILEQ